MCLLYSVQAADSSFSALSVGDLLSQSGWIDYTCPGRRQSACPPPSHTHNFREIKSHEIDLDPSTTNINFAIFDKAFPNYVHANVRLTNVGGIRTVKVRTGPRSLDRETRKNMQHTFWAFGLIPEIEIELHPRDRNNNLIAPVIADFIIYFNNCTLEHLCSTESIQDDVIVGIENAFTTQMVFQPLSTMLHKVNDNVLGESALHLQLVRMTHNTNRLMLTRTADATTAVFNMAQGSSCASQYTVSMWTFILLLFIVLGLLILILMAGFIISDMHGQNRKARKLTAELVEKQDEMMHAVTTLTAKVQQIDASAAYNSSYDKSSDTYSEEEPIDLKTTSKHTSMGHETIRKRV